MENGNLAVLQCGEENKHVLCVIFRGVVGVKAIVESFLSIVFYMKLQQNDTQACRLTDGPSCF